jgi:type II secretory ATPase GspE/PulE/Tfp pilus assembly ATPase PilB-like protein
MNFQLWGALGLRAACLQDIERECGPFDPERQPLIGRLAIVNPEHERLRTRQMVERLRAQEPVERIINALLLSAIRDGAQRLKIEPDAQGVRVLLLVGERERQHLHLPSTTLAPLVERFRSMAALSTDAPEGRFRIQIERRSYLLRIWMQSTPWGERVEVAFAPGS